MISAAATLALAGCGHSLSIHSRLTAHLLQGWTRILIIVLCFTQFLTLAHNFGLKVVAEGTETLEEVNALVAIGCEYAQGYYFYRPMDENKAMRLLEPSHFAKH